MSRKILQKPGEKAHPAVLEKMKVEKIGFSTWKAELCLGLRIPAMVIFGIACYNTRLFYDAGLAWQPDSRYATVKGKLLKLQRHKYAYIAVPRYTVQYEFEVDGKTYVSKRATTGSPYRDWMGEWYDDTITEAQYLQSIPLLRVGEACTVLYDRFDPKNHSAVAHDACSWEASLMLFAGAFVFLMANGMRVHWQTKVLKWRKTPSNRVFVPRWARGEMPPPPPPPSA